MIVLRQKEFFNYEGYKGQFGKVAAFKTKMARNIAAWDIKNERQSLGNISKSIGGMSSQQFNGTLQKNIIKNQTYGKLNDRTQRIENTASLFKKPQLPDTKKNPYQSFGASSMNAAPLKPQNNTMKNLATLGTIAAVGAGVGSWLDKKDED